MAVRMPSPSAGPQFSREHVEEIFFTLDKLPSAPAFPWRLSTAGPSVGFNLADNAVFLQQLHDALPGTPEQEQAGNLRRELWRHGLGVACAAEMLAREAGVNEVVAKAFLCGLLHDIGKIALDACFPKSYSRVVKRVQKDGQCICDAEREILGLDHTVAGKYLLTRWTLPCSIIECAWLHHQPPQLLPMTVKHPVLVRLIHLADGLVRREQIGFSGFFDGDDGEATAAKLGLKPDTLKSIVDRLPEQMGQYARVIGLDRSACRGMHGDRELARINVSLRENNREMAVRSTFFDGLQRFNDGLTEQSEIGEVCAVAATTVKAMVGASEALVFVRADSPERLLVGFSGTRAGALLWSAVQFDEVEAAQPLPDGRGAVSPRAASASDEWLWRRSSGVVAGHPLWCVRVGDGRGTEGAMLFALDESRIAPWLKAEAEWTALSTAIAHEISTARVRRNIEYANEELLDLQRRLQSAQKDMARSRSVSMVAEMAAGAAHELNNPLSVISGRAQMLLAHCQDPEQRRALSIIVEQAQNATTIVGDLMDFAKPAAPRPELQWLAALLESLCQHWRGQYALDQDQLPLSLMDAGVSVYADARQLREILEAVVRNAVEASPPESIRVEVNSPSRASDEQVRIVVRDLGAGMTADVLEHAVDPFFSSRAAGRGRGLGLSRAHRLAGINGGRLWLTSKPGTGTTVVIELPTRADTGSPGAPGPVAPTPVIS